MRRMLLKRYMPTWDADCRPLSPVPKDVIVNVLDEYRVLEGFALVAAIEIPELGERRRVFASDLRAA